MRKLQLTLAVLGLLSLSPFTPLAQAYPRVGVRIGIGFPGYYGPYYGYGYPYYGYGYYGPGPYYAAPAVVVAPSPAVVVQSAPAGSTLLPAPNVANAPPSSPQPQPSYATVPSDQPPPYVASSPAPLPTVSAVPVNPAPTVIRATSDETTRIPTKMDILLQQLSDPNESVRRDAALDLGRMKAQRAVDPLMQMLAKDSSATVREGVARALGLIASPKSMTALIYAAQADNDREVRHSAQFAVEVLRNDLRGR